MGQRNDDGLPNPITLNIYPGKQGSYNMYLDDGVSRPSTSHDLRLAEYGHEPENKNYRQVKITHSQDVVDSKVRKININRVHDNYTPVYEKFFYVAVLLDP